MGNASNAPLRSRLPLGLPSCPLLCRAPAEGHVKSNPSQGGQPAKKNVTRKSVPRRQPSEVDSGGHLASTGQRRRMETRPSVSASAADGAESVALCLECPRHLRAALPTKRSEEH